ncbi:uncharacterized protein LOC132740438 [Ruditapes philippinarum]|uniref:uncharacterized protein LOC132740438 n=1 Tax=Ruditapes philippinarum TaxID=129788 RepID=UPI00295AC1FB|nr:uncharacterized protein LOC132740438 [Ruditapes philippinarum]
MSLFIHIFCTIAFGFLAATVYGGEYCTIDVDVSSGTTRDSYCEHGCCRDNYDSSRICCDDPDSKEKNTGGIIGGCFGSLFCCCIIGGVVMYCVKRHNKPTTTVHIVNQN